VLPRGPPPPKRAVAVRRPRCRAGHLSKHKLKQWLQWRAGRLSRVENQAQMPSAPPAKGGAA